MKILVMVAAGLALSGDEAKVTVAAGTPLRVALAGKTPLGPVGTAVRGRLAEAVYVGDREALPAGTVVEGKIAELRPATKGRRMAALLSGNFTPRPGALARFDTLVLADGTRVGIQSGSVRGTAYPVTSSSRKKSIGGPGAMRLVGARLAAMPPVQKHNWPAGTRFLPELAAPVTATSRPAQPAAEREVEARLVGRLDSATAKQGDIVTAVVTRPVFGADGKVEIPEGSRVTGEVVKAKPAGMWSRNGKLHFVFRKIDTPQREARTVQGYVESVEAGFDESLTVNTEGATEVRMPKSRFVFPAVAMAVAGASFHQDFNAQGVADQDIVGRAESGAVGFGLIGTAVAQISRNVASGFAVAGAGYSVVTTFVGKGREIVLPAHTPLRLSLQERGAGPGR